MNLGGLRKLCLTDFFELLERELGFFRGTLKQFAALRQIARIWVK